MFGALYGDIIGSYYETHCTKEFDFELMPESTFTDDSVLTAAVCRAILLDPKPVGRFQLKKRAAEYAMQFKQFYSYYPHAGYGRMFIEWAEEASLRTQHSYANGAAMRAVPIGYAYDSIDQVLLQARANCLYTHNNREAIKGAQAVSAAVFLAHNGKSKNKIKEYIEKNFGYDLSATVSDIRRDYVFDSRTSYSVPPAISAFLQSHDYESAVRNAVSLGGDADTMACIAGGIAEAFYKEIPKHIRLFCDIRLDITIKRTAQEFCGYFNIKTNNDRHE